MSKCVERNIIIIIIIKKKYKYTYVVADRHAADARRIADVFSSFKFKCDVLCVSSFYEANIQSFFK
jgi:hypothetical protein